MQLRIEHLNKTYQIEVEEDTFEDCLTTIFTGPNYYLANNTDGTRQAIGLDLLRSSKITAFPDDPVGFPQVAQQAPAPGGD